MKKFFIFLLGAVIILSLYTCVGHDRTAICDELHVSEGTYYNWINTALQVFAQRMGIWI